MQWRTKSGSDANELIILAGRKLITLFSWFNFLLLQFEQLTEDSENCRITLKKVAFRLVQTFCETLLLVFAKSRAFPV